MKTQRIAIALTVINLVIMSFLLAKLNDANAEQPRPTDKTVLRGRGLEIVDSLGKVRASISVLPPSTVGGVLYPQTVLLRLIDSKGGPLVKLSAAENGAALSMTDESQGGVQILARDAGSFIKIKNQNGKEQLIKP